MIPKPDKDIKIPSNYRPISLISCLGKIFEKLIANDLVTHCTENYLLNKWQRAYLKSKELNEHLYKLTQHTTIGLKNRLITPLLLLDVEKAFDSV
jgi:hypothetical protein